MRSAALLTLLVVTGACSRAPDPVTAPDVRQSAFDNLDPEARFTGDAVCAQCHEAEWQAYQGHAMERSWYALRPDDLVEDFDAEPVFDARSGFWYRAYRESDTFWQEEYRLDATGRRTHELRLPMQFVMGSGNAARTYYADHEGWLRQLPLTWFTQVGRWAMSPGYEKANKRFDRLISERCMACHNGYPEAVPFTDGKYGSVPEGIGCERCHGPGGPHVEARRREPDPPGDSDPTIVNPARLDADRQLDVCGQCHLNTTVTVLREGRSAFDFRPSQSLEDVVALFATAGDEDEISVISHADRLKQSACFTETFRRGGTMTCTTCHDPHSTFRDRGPGYFDATCRSCHPAAEMASTGSTPELRRTHTEGEGCASCHMPYQAAGEAPHASFTDHRIRVVRPGGDAAALPGPETLDPVFERDRTAPDADRYAGIASIVLARQRGELQRYRDGLARLERHLARIPEDEEAHFLAGFALVALGETERAIPYLEAAVRTSVVPERFNALAEAYASTGRDPAATERLYRRALDAQPALAPIRVNLGRFLEAQGRADEAREEYRQAIAEQPWLAEAHFNLGTSLLAAGQREDARRTLDEAIRLDPDYGKALGNRALLALQEGDRALGRSYLERAARAAPDDPVITGNYGALLLEDGNARDAVPVLERAVGARPDHFDALVNLAVALANLDRGAEARPFAERAVRLRPGDARARSLLQSL